MWRGRRQSQALPVSATGTRVPLARPRRERRQGCPARRARSPSAAAAAAAASTACSRVCAPRWATARRRSLPFSSLQPRRPQRRPRQRRTRRRGGASCPGNPRKKADNNINKVTRRVCSERASAAASVKKETRQKVDSGIICRPNTGKLSGALREALLPSQFLWNAELEASGESQETISAIRLRKAFIGRVAESVFFFTAPPWVCISSVEGKASSPCQAVKRARTHLLFALIPDESVFVGANVVALCVALNSTDR